jgi:ribosomal protein S18 acetylase RimI-like enzyme
VPFTIRRGTAADAGPLAQFAERTFREAFAADNRPEDLELYTFRSYGQDRQTTELNDPRIVTLLLEADRILAGYAQLRGGDPPACVPGTSPLELWRFYVDRPWQGTGAAQALMAAAEEAAVERGAGTLWLGVWERNGRGQAFYRKCGFVDVGSQPFVLGTDRQTDRVMARALPAGRTTGVR